jgi:uncharacterized repeat protein (TIGR04138 family)
MNQEREHRQTPILLRFSSAVQWQSFAEDSVDPKLLDLTREDPRYTYEAYEFVCDAVSFTQERLGKGDEEREDRHVNGSELLRGACELAVREFGMMAPMVFRMWGIQTTDDFGELVFRLIKTERLSKSDRDDPADFHAVFDLQEALTSGFSLTLGSDLPRRGDR